MATREEAEIVAARYREAPRWRLFEVEARPTSAGAWFVACRRKAPDLTITWHSESLGWIVFDASARNADPFRTARPLFAVGPRPRKRGAMRGANEAYAWLARQRYGAPQGKLRARRSDSVPRSWYVDDESGRNYAIADTLEEAKACIRIVERNDPPLPEGFGQ